jgi:outer membrane protein insertion porin family
MRHPLRLLLITGLLWISSVAHAAEFVITDIRVEGLQRIAAGTVFNYLPARVGDRISDDDAAALIRSLYKTGFFKDVQLERDGGVLVIVVQERPSVSEINISGNKDIETDQLKAGLKDVGLAEGRVFNQLVLQRMTEELKRQYYDRGKYSAQIDTTVTPLERNRVAVDIDIREGKTARIKQINIVGNEIFEEDDLLDEFTLDTGGWLSIFLRDDQYSRAKLQADLESLRSYYQDRGYLQFSIDSTQVNISPDKESIFITVNITEGDLYTISDVKLAGRPVVAPELLFPSIHLVRGDPFSRKKVVESAERVSAQLSDQGYAFANVNPVPEIDEASKTVVITYYIDPGKRVYVRRINISGNSRSRDRVIRREMQQQEASWFSAEKVSESRMRLQRLGYFEEVNIETPAVPGSADEVDVEVAVKERATGSLSAGIGYSQSGGVAFQAQIREDNFFGTGKKVTLGFNTSDVNTIYELIYNNPYYTINGVSRGFTLSYRETDLERLDAARYAADTGVALVNFGFPISGDDRLGVAAGLEYTNLKVTDGSPNEVKAFVASGGQTTDPAEVEDLSQASDSYSNWMVNTFWNHDSRDSAIFPRQGWFARLDASIAVPGSDLKYYKLNYQQRNYVPLGKAFTLATKLRLGYGNGYGDDSLLPIYEYFFLGGPGSVRGYKAFSMGPRDSNNDPIGGNTLLNGNVELWFPPPFITGVEETMKLAAFFDIGNVFDTHRDEYDFDVGDLRYTTGLAATWLSPLGVLTLSYGFPLNEQEDDRIENFQFTFGTSF